VPRPDPDDEVTTQGEGRVSSAPLPRRALLQEVVEEIRVKPDRTLEIQGLLPLRIGPGIQESV